MSPLRLVVLFLVTLTLFLLPTPTPASDSPTPPAYRITGPYTHDNLSLYLIHPTQPPATADARPYLTLDEALAAKKVIVHETGNVNELAIENRSDEDVFIQSGDIVKGGQQDRTLATDLVLPARSGRLPVAAFCVEAGRWTRRGSEEVAYFSASTASVPSKDLKLAIRAGDQQTVWANVAQIQERLSANTATGVQAAASPSSLQLTLENPKLNESTDAYLKKLSPTIDDHPGAIGLAVAINGRLSSADTYASPALFKKLWPRLLRSSATEAFASVQKDAARATPPDPQSIDALLRQAPATPTKTADVNTRTQSTHYDTPTLLLSETHDKSTPTATGAPAGTGGFPLHRSLLTKDPSPPTPQPQP